MATLLKRGDTYLIRRGFWPFYHYLDSQGQPMWWWGRSTNPYGGPLRTEEAAMARWAEWKRFSTKPATVKIRTLS